MIVSMRGWLAVVGWAASGCGAAESGHFGVPVDTESVAEASTGTSASTSMGAPPECVEDADCGGGRCDEGACLPCQVADECEDGALCLEGACVPWDEVGPCEVLGVARCGDGQLQAPELCDGGADCTDCARTIGVQAWGDPLEAYALAVASDGSVAAATFDDEGRRLHILDPEGVTRRVVLTDTLVGVTALEDGFVAWGGTLVAYSERGDERWSLREPRPCVGLPVRDVGTRGVLLAGSIDQPNSPTSRGMVCAVSPTGALLFEAHQGDSNGVLDAVWVDGEVVLAGPRADAGGRTMLRRLHDDGSVRWTDAGYGPMQRPTLLPDGHGGVWFIEEYGVDAVRLDADGEPVERLSCLGSVDGRLWSTVRRPVPVLHVRTGLEGEDGSWSWLMFGGPGEATTAWLTPARLDALAWTPSQTLLVAADGESSLLEVTP